MIKGSDKTAGLQLPVIVQHFVKKRFGSLKKLSYLYKVQNKVTDWLDQMVKLRTKFFKILKIVHIVTLCYIVTDGRLWSLNKLRK